MNRRDALSRVALILGGTVIGAGSFLEGCRPADKKTITGLSFTDQDIEYLDEIAETIIPATDTPGAKAAKVGAFMSLMVTDCYEEKEQRIFIEGMNTINNESKKKFDKVFMQLSATDKADMLTVIDKETKEYNKNKKPEDPVHYFRLIKELTVLGYFTSEPGATQALNYIETPGRYEGCIPYKKGDRI